MAVTFPVSLDDFTNPASSDALNSPSHAGQHSDSNDAIEALQSKIGIDSSADATSIDYKLTNSSSSNPGHKHTLADGASDVTATSSEVNKLSGFSGDISSTSGSQTLTNKTISSGSVIDANVTVTEVLKKAYPVGSIYINAGVSTDPATLMGFGTWSAFGAGKVLVGLDSADTAFDTLEETGGAKTHTLTSAEMPSHTHTQDSHNHTQNSHNHTQNAHSHTTRDDWSFKIGTGTTNTVTGGSSDPRGNATSSTTATNIATTATNQATTATNQNTGGGGAHNNLQPYIVVYMWKRTA